MVVFLIKRPYDSAPDWVWKAFLEKMKRLPQDDASVRAAIEKAQDVLDVRSGKATRADIKARLDARLHKAGMYLRECQAAAEKAKKEKK